MLKHTVFNDIMLQKLILLNIIDVGYELAVLTVQYNH